MFTKNLLKVNSGPCQRFMKFFVCKFFCLNFARTFVSLTTSIWRNMAKRLIDSSFYIAFCAVHGMNSTPSEPKPFYVEFCAHKLKGAGLLKKLA